MPSPYLMNTTSDVMYNVTPSFSGFNLFGIVPILLCALFMVYCVVYQESIRRTLKALGAAYWVALRLIVGGAVAFIAQVLYWIGSLFGGVAQAVPVEVYVNMTLWAAFYIILGAVTVELLHKIYDNNRSFIDELFAEKPKEAATQ